MTYKRLSALIEKVSEYQENPKSYDDVVVLISFDKFSEMRAKCSKMMRLERNGQETFMGCKIALMANKKNYLAVGYKDKIKGDIYSLEEVKS